MKYKVGKTYTCFIDAVKADITLTVTKVTTTRVYFTWSSNYLGRENVPYNESLSELKKWNLNPLSKLHQILE